MEVSKASKVLLAVKLLDIDLQPNKCSALHWVDKEGLHLTLHTAKEGPSLVPIYVQPVLLEKNVMKLLEEIDTSVQCSSCNYEIFNTKHRYIYQKLFEKATRYFI